MIRLNKDLVEQEFFWLHPNLIAIIADMASYCMTRYNYTITITSMLRKKTSDSGAHETGRAVDISSKELDPDEIADIVNYLNLEYERPDGKLTCLHHDVGLGPHFHLQVPYTKSFEGQERANVNYCKNKIVKH